MNIYGTNCAVTRYLDLSSELLLAIAVSVGSVMTYLHCTDASVSIILRNGVIIIIIIIMRTFV